MEKKVILQFSGMGLRLDRGKGSEEGNCGGKRRSSYGKGREVGGIERSSEWSEA